jgi:leader peptidase (prepilin peptidase)/N-methyltransferase
MGWGDVKMAGLVGLVTGFPTICVALFIALVTGGLTAAFLLLLGLRGRKEAIPFGPFLSLGAIAALLWGSTICEWYLELL